MLSLPTFLNTYQENFTTFRSHYSKNRHSLVALLNNHLVDYPTPITLTYAWGLGSVAGIFLGLQIITGLILTMHYAPNVTLAFDILEHIMRDVNNGWLWRYLHANGASFFFAAVYMHIGRGLYYFSYVRNPAVWISGMVIFALMMATAFMGYVLPWGQMSFWGATVITNLFSAIPLIGTDIAYWLWGGFSVDNPTLNRFYTLHFLLPFVIAGVAGLHLILLHRPGSTNPLAIFDASSDKIPFFPYFYWKDLTGFLFIIICYAFYVFFTPDALGHPDNYIEGNPMVTPTHIVPEWYFLPFYAILRSIPDKLGGVVLMAASIIILFVLAIFNTFTIAQNKKGAELSFFVLRNNNIFHFFIWFFFITVVILAWIGSQPVTPAIVLLGQINTVIYFAWLIYFPIVALFSPEDALELFIILSLTKKLILILTGFMVWINNTYINPSKNFMNSSWAIFLFFFSPFAMSLPLNVFNNYYFLYVTALAISLYFIVYHAPRKILEYHIIELIFFTALSIVPLCLLIKIPENWIHFYLLFETSALSTTILISSRRYNPYAISASLMYYFTSIIVSIFLLLGIFFLYCEFGSFEIILSSTTLPANQDGILEQLQAPNNFRTIGVFCILFSLAVKIGVAPFHGWLIGVNSGAPLHITAYLQTIYKAILLLVFIKLLWHFKMLNIFSENINFLLGTTGILTLFICGITALLQSGLKQFWAYLSNATIGFLFILLGLQQYLLAVIYLFFYILTAIIFFAIILTLTKTNKITFLYITDFKYTQAINVYFAGLLIFLILMFAGLPPTAIFFVKFVSYFTILKNTGMLFLLVITLLHLITAFLYLKILKIILFDRFSYTTTIKTAWNGSIVDIVLIYSLSGCLIFCSYNWTIVYQICTAIFSVLQY